MTKLYLSFLFGLYIIVNSKGQDNSHFFHLSPNLENESIFIKNTVQDRMGYIWMSHDKGVSKYDGYEYWFYSFESIFDRNDFKSVVKRIAIDESDNILVLSSDGLLSKIENNNKFTLINSHFSTRDNYVLINKIFTKNNELWLSDFSGNIYSKNTITNKIDSITTIQKSKSKDIEVFDLEVTKNNELLISTNSGLLYKYALETKLLEEIKGPFNNYPGYLTMTLGQNNDLWIGTENIGLFRYDLVENKFIPHSFFKDNIDLLARDKILSLFCDKNGIIWAGSDGEGLYRIDPNSGNIKLFKHNFFDKFSLSSNSIIDINEDANNNLWVITSYGNVNIMPNNKNEIYYHKGSIGSVSARILSVLKDSKGNIWIGTDGNGLIKTNPVTGKESQHLTFKNSVEGFYVQSLIEDDNGNIWIGTFKNGLWIYDWKSDQFSKINVSIPNGIQATNISALFKDSKGRIWIGSDISVALYDKNKYELFSFSYYDKGLYGEISRSIIEDSDKNIWVGMDRGGLFKFNETSELEKSNFQRHAFTKEGNGVNEYYAVPSMVADSNNGIWLLNFKGELSYFNTVDFSFIDYNEFDPLNDANFRAVLLQDDNNLWLSSTQGIWNFNVKDSIIRKYYKTDGFQDDFYLHKSAFKDTSGILYFGGLNGINGFDPNSISTEPVNTQLHITTIEILNKSASELIPDQIKNGIENVKQITLGNSQSSFSFRFSVIGNILNSNYFYTYRLKGFNDDWKTTKNERIASYTNIPPGNYTFEVKAGTKKGLWDIPIKTIEIKVTPPFWNHPIAYLLYFILFCTIIYMIYRWYKLRRNLFFQKLKNSQEKQIYREKVNFFSKMSHEIQTPLTLILGPIENMLKNAETDGNLLLNQRLNIVANNAKILSKIAFDLTTIRNKEIGQLKLKVYKRDVIKKINETSESFLEQARLKNIDFERKNFVESFELWFDGELIEHIIYNLLSNAFKFTPRDGKITIQTKISDQKNMFIIKVKDSGYGISEKEQANIFKLFYRANEMKDSEGTGIGLALVKEFIDLHKGQVYVDSKMGVGTEFTVYLPLNKDVYTNEEIVDDFAKEQISENKIKIQLPQELINIEKSKKKKHSLLIVEDNFDMQYFLKDLFSKYYNVILADNGSEGLAIAEKQQPNIIISDVSMPIMNGIEMCKKLQENHRTYHIPIILLTAKNSTKTKFEGLGHGAVEFINKPFDIKELLLKTHNILTNYEKSISNFTAQYLSVPQQTKSKPKDVVFLEDLIRKLNSELNNPEFKLDSLADTFNMSYSVIYRKCQKLTGKTIIDLFRLMRLKKAAILISKNGYSISEACFAVGFNDTKYFSRSFKEEFNITPSGFKKEALASDFDSFLEKYKLH